MRSDYKTKKETKRRQSICTERRFLAVLNEPSKEELRQMLADAMRNTAGLVVSLTKKDSPTA